MKTTIYLALVIGALALGAASTANAQSVFLSPRGWANQIRVGPGISTNDPNLLTNRPVGNAKAWALQQSFRTVAVTNSGIDLAHAPRPNFSPKDPRFESALRSNALLNVQIAPLK
jgi:hypothetical protein